MELKAYSNF